MSPFVFAPLVAPAVMVLACALLRGETAPSAGAFVPAAAPSPVPVAFAPPAIARLVTQGRVLSIRAATGATRFDVEDRSGRVLASGLAEAELQLRFPDLHELIDPLRAARASAYLDASVDAAALRGPDAERLP